MTLLSETSAAVKWLSNRFEADERVIAISLIDEMLLVSRDDFAEGLNKQLKEVVGQGVNSKRTLALFAETSIKKAFGRTPAFFKGSRSGRATGTGRAPITVDPRDQEVGSEGVVSNIITDYCRRHPSTCLSHPGPTKMRKDKVRDIVIVTDFIGSGKRVKDMLESFRYVASMRSWRSYRLVRFIIVAYSGTTKGIAAVRSHKLKPEVRIVMGCPTIDNTFAAAQKIEIEKLCNTYPKGHKEPLGYKGGGALIVFAHSCPNNAPPILHSRKSKWVPLFSGRSSFDSSEAFIHDDKLDTLEQRPYRLQDIRKARVLLNCIKDKGWVSVMLILAAVKSGRHSAEQISSQIHVEIIDVEEIILLAIKVRWLSNNVRLTELGKQELVRLRKRRKRTPILASKNSEFYYPTQLRAS